MIWTCMVAVLIVVSPVCTQYRIRVKDIAFCGNFPSVDAYDITRILVSI